MSEANKIYTAEDFQRYHSGTMPTNEMHALEKAALEDPFLADALDGYAYSQNIESDIAELQSRLEEKQKQKNVFSISSVIQHAWWRIAALFIVIAGAGFLFYKINFGNKKSSLAKNEIKNIKPQSDSIVFNKKDTVTTKGDPALQTQPAPAFAKKEKKSLLHERSLFEKEVYSTEKKSEPALAESKRDSTFINHNADSFKKDYYAQAAPKYLLKGKVTDEKGNPVGFATIKDNNSDKAVVTDTTGKFLLQLPDSNTTATVSLAGYATKNVALQKDEESIIAMNKRKDNLDEVVVTGYGQKKQARKTGSALKSLSRKVAGVEISDSIPQPIGGNDKFNAYVKENEKPQLDENNERISGEVTLSFINKKGRPYNIKVIKSSCMPCEKEAIRLLQNGPDWSGKNNKRGTVIIKFQ